MQQLHNDSQEPKNQSSEIYKKIKNESKYLFAGGVDGNLYVWNMKYMKTERTYQKLMDNYIKSLALTSDKSQLFVSDYSGN